MNQQDKKQSIVVDTKREESEPSIKGLYDLMQELKKDNEMLKKDNEKLKCRKACWC